MDDLNEKIKHLGNPIFEYLVKRYVEEHGHVINYEKIKNKKW